MDWAILTYRVPQDPSRHRVAIWRELRRAGAVSLQQATWALPLHPATDATIDRVLALVERAEGDAIVFTARPRDQAMAGRIEDSFLEGREAEWQEFVRECDESSFVRKHEIGVPTIALPAVGGSPLALATDHPAAPAGLALPTTTNVIDNDAITFTEAMCAWSDAFDNAAGLMSRDNAPICFRTASLLCGTIDGSQVAAAER